MSGCELVSPPIGKALAANAEQRNISAFAVGDIFGRTVEIKLGQIAGIRMTLQ